jgi:hypothetical protein
MEGSRSEASMVRKHAWGVYGEMVKISFDVGIFPGIG